MLEINEFVASTPAEDFIKSGLLSGDSSYPLEHTSDVFRLLLLWKYSGTYLDSDMIVRKQVALLGENFACLENDNGLVANAFLNFDANDGKRLVEIFMRDQMKNYDAKAWAQNGPLMMTRVLHSLCHTNTTNEMISKKNCDGFHVFSKEYCYPISYSLYNQIFNETFTKSLLEKITLNSVTVHMSNKLTKSIKTKRNDNNLYTTLARQYCPEIFDSLDDNEEF